MPKATVHTQGCMPDNTAVETLPIVYCQLPKDRIQAMAHSHQGPKQFSTVKTY